MEKKGVIEEGLTPETPAVKKASRPACRHGRCRPKDRFEEDLPRRLAEKAEGDDESARSD